MAFSLNKVILIGTLGRDAEVKQTSGGSQVANFSVATERSWKDKATDEWKKETNWTNCILWNKPSVTERLRKGSKVGVEGRLSTRSYEDKDGKKVYVTEVICDDVILLDKKGESGNSGDFEGDLPF